VQKHIIARDDVDDVIVSRSGRADARQGPGCINDARRVVIRSFEDGHQSINEAEHEFLGCGLVGDGVDKRPQSVPMSLPRIIGRFQHETNYVEEDVNMGFCGPWLVGQHVTQQCQCALVDLTTAEEQYPS